MTKVALIGAGNMARALAQGLLRAGGYTLSASHPREEVRDLWSSELGVRMHADNAAAAAGADVVIVCVKPHKIADVKLTGDGLIVSVAAGVPVAALSKYWGASARIVRAMPNQPALLGAGATGLFAGANATADDLARAQTIFEAVGAVFVLDEETQLDTVTALAGSAPAFIYRVAQALAEAAIAEGLPADVAYPMSIQTVHGAGAILHHENADLKTLISRVASPGGTTEAGLAALGSDGVDALLAAAIHAATARAAELRDEHAG